MVKKYSKLIFSTLTLVIAFVSPVLAQFGGGVWTDDGYGNYRVMNGEIVQSDIRNPQAQPVVIVSKALLTPQGATSPIAVRRFAFSTDKQKVLINNNTRRVWRQDTRGDYWVLDLQAKKLRKVGAARPESSLMFAKLSPDGAKIAYVSQNNLFVEDANGANVKQLTTDGTKGIINGTFDWVYEEELDCRDGFRWSPDSKAIAYWHLDARKIKNYLMLNTTDSIYPFTVPVEYPVVGEDPSSCKVGVVQASGGPTMWMNVPGDPVQHYLPRMEWAANSNELIVQQLNRRQNESNIILLNAATGAAKIIWTETDKAWVEAKPGAVGWDWLQGGKSFAWLSEKDGWNHLYVIDRNGKERLVTTGNFDVISLKLIDEKAGVVYFMASPDNATQAYLYKTKLDGSSKPERVTPADQVGSHSYDISPNGKIATHSYSSHLQAPVSETITLPDLKVVSTPPAAGGFGGRGARGGTARQVEFFKVTTVDGVTLDGWMVKPTNFDPAKKYPVVFYVYGEPASSTVGDRYGLGGNQVYAGNMADDGYIYASLDNRGSPSPRGREWRKSIYHNIGVLNIRDQAMGAQQFLKQYSFADTGRVAVWGWSGGGSSTLNLLFQYPEIYKTGISVAAVDNQLNYDNIYQERYMGLLPDDRDYYVKGSPISHAQNLKGNLLIVHGTGDDNVHYNNAEQMFNQLIKYNKVFSMMVYPNRTHGISEGEGTTRHLATICTQFLREHCPPGGR